MGESHHFIHAFNEAVAQRLLRLVQDGLTLLAVAHSVLCSALTLTVLLAINIPQVFCRLLRVRQLRILQLLGKLLFYPFIVREQILLHSLQMQSVLALNVAEKLLVMQITRL